MVRNDRWKRVARRLGVIEVPRAVHLKPSEQPRILKQADARRRTSAMAPGALYGSLRNAIEQGVQGLQTPTATAVTA